MANEIKLKRGSGSDPSASDLAVGEIAIRTDNGKLFTKKDNGSVAEISGSGGGGIDDGDKGDITVSNGGDTWTIDDGAVTSAKIQNDLPVNKLQVNNNHIIVGNSQGDGQLRTISGDATIDNTAVLTIANDAVTTAKIATDAVTSDSIADDAVTQAHIATDAIVTANIVDDNVTGAKIEDDVALAGNPTTTTQSAGNNTTRIATTAFVTTAVNNIDAIPSGMLAPFAMGTAPSGFLACDGAAVSRSTYSSLFSAIGTTYGAGDGSSTFNVPDM